MILITCAFCYPYLGKDFGYSASQVDEYRICYMFAHVNILHLGVNLFSYFILSRLLRGTVFSPICLAIGYLATFGTEMDTPTIGISAVCFAQMGIVSAYDYQFKWCQLMWVSCIILNSVGYAMGTMNCYLHGVAFLYGLTIALTFKLVQRWLK